MLGPKLAWICAAESRLVAISEINAQPFNLWTYKIGVSSISVSIALVSKLNCYFYTGLFLFFPLLFGLLLIIFIVTFSKTEHGNYFTVCTIMQWIANERSVGRSGGREKETKFFVVISSTGIRSDSKSVYYTR